MRTTILISLLLICGCGGQGGGDPDTGTYDALADETDVDGEDTTAPDVVLDTSGDPAADQADLDGQDVDAVDALEEDVPPSPCPPLMALVDGRFCIDRFEASLEQQQTDGSWIPASPYETVGERTVRAVVADSIVPQGYISGLQAAAACEASGKRLCTSDEWLLACRGPEEWVYPYGDDHLDGACNDHYDGSHPLVDYFGTSDGIWDSAHMNDPGINQQTGTVAAGGEFTGCESDWHVFDMHGNLHEWTSDTSGVFRGGFYADASINGPGCTYVTTAHSTSYHDYSTGFRCCADP